MNSIAQICHTDLSAHTSTGERPDPALPPSTSLGSTTVSTSPFASTPTPFADEDETRVARARRKATLLATAMVRDPLDRTVHEEMRRFLDEESEPALLSWEAMLTRTPAELRDRIRVVITDLAHREAS